MCAHYEDCPWLEKSLKRPGLNGYINFLHHGGIYDAIKMQNVWF